MSYSRRICDRVFLLRTKSYPLQRALFLSLSAVLAAAHEIEVKAGRLYPLTAWVSTSTSTVGPDLAAADFNGLSQISTWRLCV